MENTVLIYSILFYILFILSVISAVNTYVVTHSVVPLNVTIKAVFDLLHAMSNSPTDQKLLYLRDRKRLVVNQSKDRSYFGMIFRIS